MDRTRWPPTAARSIIAPCGRLGDEALSFVAMVSLAGACAGDVVVTLTVPADVEVALVVRGDSAVVQDPVRLPANGDPVTVLYYSSPLEDLLFEVDADGQVVRAPSEQDSWPLPLTARGATFDPEAAIFTDERDSAVLAARTAQIRVSPAPCGDLRLTSQHPLAAGVTDPAMIATIGDNALVTTIVEHALFSIQGDVVRRLSLGFTPAAISQLAVFADDGAFLVVYTSTSVARTFRVSLDGTITPRTETRSSTVAASPSAHWPGSDTMLVRFPGPRYVGRLDLVTGLWDRVFTAPAGPHDTACDLYDELQLLRLDAADAAVTSFASLAPHRVSLGDRTSLPIVAPAVLASSCQSSSAQFPSGAELVSHIASLDEIQVGGDKKLAWRARSSDDWTLEESPIWLHSATPANGVVVAIDGLHRDVVLLTFEPRRSDRAPRICDQLGLSRVRRLGFDGQKGMALLQANAAALVEIAHFEVTLP